MKLDKLFFHNYEVVQLQEFDFALPIYYYPGAYTTHGKDGLILKVTASNDLSWIGIFAFGSFDKNGFSGLFTMPDDDKFCVVSNGTGYIVSAYDPENWEEVKSIPIKAVKSVNEKEIILFSNYTDIAAYDKAGLKWTSKNLSKDGLKITRTDDKFIYGNYYDLSYESDREFKIDALSGIRMEM